jgi:hypothetical protein
MILVYVIGGLVVGAALIGFGVLCYRDIRAGLYKSRMSPQDAVLYRKAARILNRLINVTELDGDMAVDVVSVQTRRAIEVWLIEYNKEIDKV